MSKTVTIPTETVREYGALLLNDISMEQEAGMSGYGPFMKLYGLVELFMHDEYPITGELTEMYMKGKARVEAFYNRGLKSLEHTPSPVSHLTDFYSGSTEWRSEGGNAWS